MSLTIGALAKETGLGIETLRFYEREGLIPEPPRTSSGYRAYEQDAVSRINFIRGAQGLGFTLKEVRELIALQMDTGADCGRVRHTAAAKLSNVEQKIADLTRMRDELSRLIESCSASGTVADCRIMECLAAHDSSCGDPDQRGLS
jgi:MerR family transcriptional regulator, copper efflux regulator